MVPMNDEVVEELLGRAGKAVMPDPARLKAALSTHTSAVPSPLLVTTYVRTAVVAFALVLLVGGTQWFTTPTEPIAEDEINVFLALFEEEHAGETEALALFDERVEAELAPVADAFTDEFLDAAL